MNQKNERLTPDFNKNIQPETEGKINALKEVVPEIFADGRINIDSLRESVGDMLESEETGAEHFAFTWPGKRDAKRITLTPPESTLVPCPGEGIDEENTGNIFIEGENLEVLKLLQKSYNNKIKMIYIDPPYNTGNDFVYDDNFTEPLENYLRITGQIDDKGKSTVTNKETSGRFHSKWLSMMYPRLKLARNLLREDGVIFISIGQAELSNLVILLDEIFGQENRISICTRMMKSGGQKGKFFSPNTDYVLVYAKQLDNLENFRGEISQELQEKVYNQVESEGPRKGEMFRTMGLFQSSLDPLRGCTNQRYYIETPDGTFVIPNGDVFPKIKKEGEKVNPVSKNDGVWRWTYSKYIQEKNNGNILFKETKSSPLVDQNGKVSKWNIYTKIWLNNRLEEGSLPLDLFDKFENRHSSKEIAKLNIPFDYSKPTELLAYLMQIININSNELVLDFFAGSCSTADAAFKYEILSSNPTRWICVQLPEIIFDSEDAYKQGFKTVSEIGKERIRRSIKKIKEENKDKLIKYSTSIDLGFKVYKQTRSNFKKWQNITTDKISEVEKLFEDSIDPLVNGWKKEDLLTEILLMEGYPLDSKIESFDQKKCKGVLKISSPLKDSPLVVSLESKVTKEVIDNLNLESKDDRFICLDSALDDVLKVTLHDKCKLVTI